MIVFVLLKSYYSKAEAAQCRWNQEAHTAFAVRVRKRLLHP